MRKLLLFVCAIMMMGLTACLQAPYSSDVNKTKGKNPLGVDAPDVFDWSNVQDVSVTVTVDDQFAGQYKYRVELFTVNPMTDASAQSIRGVVTSSTQTVSVSIPQGVKTLYLRQTDPLSRTSVQAVEVASTHLNCDFSADQIVKSTLLGKNKSVAVESNSTVVATPSDAISISGSAPVFMESGKSYLVAKGSQFSGSVSYPGSGNTSLFIEGDWNVDNNIVTLQTGCRLVVQSSGVVTVSSNTTIQMIQASSLQIADGGKLEGKHLNIYFTDREGSVTNLGSLSVYNITFATHGSFVTKGELAVSNKLTCNDNTTIEIAGAAQVKELDVIGGTIINNATLELKSLSMNSNNARFVNNATVAIADGATLINTSFHNHCLVTLADKSQLTLSGTEFTIHDGALLNAYDVVLSNGTSVFDLGAQSMLDVRREIRMTSNQNVIKGISKSQSLARMREVKLSGWETVFYRSIQVEVEKHAQNNNQWDRKYVLEATAAMVGWGASTVTITPNDCSGTGNHPGGGSGNPEDQDDTLIYPTSYTYLFEDNWPYMGDYDLNDMVIELARYEESVQNRSLIFHFRLLAVGAAKCLGAAVQFDGVEVAHIEKFNCVGGDNSSLESGQTYGVVSLFSDAHRLLYGASGYFPINTTQMTYTPKDITVEVIFKSVEQLKAFTISKLNLFVTTSEPAQRGKRKEIHLNGYAPTNLADVSFFGTGDDNSKVHLYKSVDNYVWGIMIPQQISYPLECRNISLAYPNFTTWIAAGGQQSTDWYMNVSSENVCK